MMIADLHCDLLLYLESGGARTANDKQVRCSISQMKEGEVNLQVLPIFTETGAGSSEKGKKQNAIFHALPHQYPGIYHPLKKDQDFDAEHVTIIRSIENASSFCEEEEPLEAGLARLQQLHHEGPIAYISLTWNGENRFGGGNHTDIGLKSDGKALLNTINGKRIAADLSHTSDRLAYDILEHIEKHNLDIPVIASHSNCRTVYNAPRNLPDDLITEIIKKGGLIGLNFIKPFLGPDSPASFVRQMEHLLSLGNARHVCFGADFFFEEDIPPSIRRPPGAYFFNDYGNSSTYPKVLDLWKKELGLATDELQGIAYGNARNFLSLKII